MIKNFIPKSMLFILLLFGGLSTAIAQTGMVKGVIVDASNGSPLPGATVQVRGTTRGTVSDLKGNYSISVKAGATLVFSYVGYVTQEKVVQPNTTVNVRLQATASNLNELVVIGYGAAKKSDLTGSITSVNTATLPKGMGTSLTSVLTGKVAGMNITTEGGQPGSAATVRIRGGSSIFANNSPLYVVDGVPLYSGSSNSVSGVSNPLSFLNPEDVENVTVLKGASATAIYGSRASNGVILITTKKGSLNQKLSISYNVSTAITTLPKMMDVLGANQFSNFIKSYWGANSSQAAMLGSSNTNWQKEIFQTGLSQNHFLSFTGAAGKLPYRVSVGYTDEHGTLKTSWMKRTTGSVDLSPTLLKGDLKVNLNLNGSYITNRFANTGAIGSAQVMDPTQPVYSINGATFSGGVHTNFSPYGSPYGDGYFMWMQNGTPVSLATANPLSILELEHNLSYVYQSTGSLQLDYKIHWVPGLAAHLELGYNISHSNGSDNLTQNSPVTYVWGSEKKGSAEHSPYYMQQANTNLHFYLDYQKQFGVNNIKIMGGYSWQRFFQTTWSANYYLTDSTQDVPRVDYPEEYYLLSFFGRLNYTLNNKYLLTATVRNDGSSRVAQHWGLFPSVAVAWRINQENALKNVSWLSNLKLRLSVGETGQEEIPSGYYPYLANYTTNAPNNGAAYLFGNTWYQLIRPNSFNTSLKWETTTTYDGGLDFGFLNERIRGSVDVYKRITNNLLNNIPAAAGTNFSNYLWSNIGQLQNTGVEVTIAGTPIASHSFTWNINFTMSYNQNRVNKLTRAGTKDYPGIPTGGISGGTGNTIELIAVGHSIDAYYVYHQLYYPNGKPIEGAYANGGKYITSYTGTPPWTFGFSSRMDWKNWYLNFAGHADVGNYNYNNVFSGRDGLFYTYTLGYLQTTTPQAIATGFNNPQYMSDYFIQNASFLRMDNITLGYNFNNIVKGKLRASLYGTVQNPFIITKYKGLDPEVSGGIDNNIYPRSRVYILGLRVNFK